MTTGGGLFGATTSQYLLRRPNKLLKMCPARPLSLYFRPFLIALTKMVQKTINGKSIDGVLRIRTRDRRMERADLSTDQISFWQRNLNLIPVGLSDGRNRTYQQ